MGCVRAEVSLEFCEGGTFWSEFVWKSGPTKDSLVPVDLTGYSGECHIRDKISDEQPVFILEPESGVVIPDQTDPEHPEDVGRYILHIPAAGSQGKCPDHKDRYMVYDLKLTAPDGTVRVHQFGEIVLNASVTRPWELTP